MVAKSEVPAWLVGELPGLGFWKESARISNGGVTSIGRRTVHGYWRPRAQGCRCGKDEKGVRWLLHKEHWEDVMHAVIRTFSGSGATKLLDLLEGRKSEVEALIRPVKGFVNYSLIRTPMAECR